MSVNLEELALRSIDQYARVETRLASVESSLLQIRSENAKMLSDFTSALQTLAQIQERLVNNIEDHKILHQRVDDVKDELDDVNTAIGSLKTTCAGNGHTREQMKHLAQLIEQLQFAAKIFGYTLFGAPVWIIVMGMVIIGFVIDVVSHKDLVILLLGMKP